MTYEVVLEKLKYYCAYQERCQQEVKQKLAKLKFYGREADTIIVDLIAENFLNEERYAKAFAGGKFRIKGWGKQKIRIALKSKGISEKCIVLGLDEIQEEDYIKKLREKTEKLKIKYADMNEYERNGKILKALLLQGYEKEKVKETLSP